MDLGVYIDCKLHFLHGIDFLSSNANGNIRANLYTYTFLSTIDSLLILYLALARSNLEYASIAYNSVTSTDSKKLEHKKNLAALCHNKFFQDVEFYYGSTFPKLNLQTIKIRSRHFDAFFNKYLYWHSILPLCPRNRRHSCSYSEHT